MQMTPEHEVECARRIEAGVYAQHLLQQGDRRPGLQAVVADGLRARDELWLAHIGLVEVVARRFCRGRDDIFRDLVQEGHLVLVDVMLRYDWTRGVRFATHAWPWLHRELQTVMRRRTRWERATTRPERTSRWPRLSPSRSTTGRSGPMPFCGCSRGRNRM